MTYKFCPVCGRNTMHSHINKVHSVDHDYGQCMECGSTHHIEKHIPSFIGIRVRGLGGNIRDGV